jgi:hypothetical protein
MKHSLDSHGRLDQTIRRREEPMFRIVLLDGREYQTHWQILHLAIAWQNVRDGNGEVMVCVYDANNVGRQVNIRKLDAAKTFGDVIFSSAPSSPPPPIKAA